MIDLIYTLNMMLKRQIKNIAMNFITKIQSKKILIMKYMKK